jgi:hypothetical protein
MLCFFLQHQLERTSRQTLRSAQPRNKTQQEIYSHFGRIRKRTRVIPQRSGPRTCATQTELGRTRRTLHWIANTGGVTVIRRPCSRPGVHDIASREGGKKTSALKCHQTHRNGFVHFTQQERSSLILYNNWRTRT